MSVMLFKISVYSKFFETDGTITLMAGLSMLAGVLSMVILWAINLSFQTYLSEDKAFIQFITSRRFLDGYVARCGPLVFHGLQRLVESFRMAR